MIRVAVFLISAQCWAATLSISTTPTGKTTGTVTLTGACDTGGAQTFSWSNVSGPATGVFGSASSATTTFTTPAATSGTDYVVQLVGTGTCASTVTAHVGAVVVDVNEVVQTGESAKFDLVLGPQTRSGTTAYSYYDIAERALADIIATTALANPPSLGSAFTGTVQVFSDGFTPAHIQGVGTLFSTELIPAASPCDGSGTHVIIAWNTIDGAGTGRYADEIRSVSDNTHAVLCIYQNQIDLASGLTMYRYPATTSTFAPSYWQMGGGNPSSTWNYYDVALALYRLYYRTGLAIYQTQARALADLWWQWGIDHGRLGISPRYAGLQSQFLRALDGQSARLPDLQIMANNYLPSGATHQTLPASLTNLGITFDSREAGYMTWFQAIGAAADTGARHTTYCSNLVSTILPAWIAQQRPEGFWSEDDFFQSNYFYLVPGNSPWRMDLPIHALQMSYEVMRDTSAAGCNQSALAATLLGVIGRAVDWTYNYGRSDPTLGGNGGVYYDVGYETNGQIGSTGAGTVSATRTSATVTGSSTSFLTDFGSSGTKYIFFDGLGASTGNRTGYKVTASGTNTSLTVSPVYGSQGETADITAGVYYITSKATTSCASAASFCNDQGYWGSMPSGDRNLVRLMAGMTAWMFHWTGSTKYKTWATNWFSNAFGGPAAGPGQGGACGGPGCDGAITDWQAALPSCVSYPTEPCEASNYNPGLGRSGNAIQYLGKNFGQGSGAPCAQCALAYIVQPTVAPARPMINGKILISSKVAR